MKKCLILMRNSPGYSGGRYNALIFSLALVRAGYIVEIQTNIIPDFVSDFKEYKELKKIKFTQNINSLPINSSPQDLVVLFPDLNPFSAIYEKSVILSKKNNSKLILHSFETPNWFNNHGTSSRRYFHWIGWKFLSKYTSSIITMTKKGVDEALKYYENKKIFNAYPSINEICADRNFTDTKQKKIFIISRFGKFQNHKGGDKLEILFKKCFSGYTFIFFGAMPAKIKSRIKNLSKEFNISLQFISNVSDSEKFSYLSECESLIFLSSFEGYGYPPLEAAYVGTPSIIYPLEVFKETLGNFPMYINSHEDIENNYHDFLKKYDPHKAKSEIFKDKSFMDYSHQINKIIEESDSIKTIPKIEYTIIWIRYLMMFFINKLNEIKKSF